MKLPVKANSSIKMPTIKFHAISMLNFKSYSIKVFKLKLIQASLIEFPNMAKEKLLKKFQ